MSADELKELGNKLMRAHPPDYNGALSAYSRALATSQGKAAACILTNRSLAFFKLGQNDKALEDANLAIETDDQYHFHFIPLVGKRLLEEVLSSYGS